MTPIRLDNYRFVVDEMSEVQSLLNPAKILLCCVVTLIFSYGHHAYGQNFEAEGRIVYQVYETREDGSTDLESFSWVHGRDFVARVDEERWFISIYREGEEGEKTASYESGFDGEYLYRYHPTNPNREGINPEIINPAGTGWIYSNPIPDSKGGDFTNHIWYGLLSQHYFSKADLSEKVSVTPLWDSESGVADVHLSSESPYLPSKIVFWYSAGNSLDNSSDAWPRAIFRRVEEIEFESYLLPSEWEYIAYRQGSNAESDEGERSVRAIATVREFRSLDDEASFSVKPEMLGEIVVHDHRFDEQLSSIEGLKYVVNDHRWPDIDAVRARPEFEVAMLREESAVTHESSSGRGIAVILIGIALIFPAAIVYVVHRLRGEGK